MNERQVGERRRTPLTISESMVLICVLGILVSVAIPSLHRLKIAKTDTGWSPASENTLREGPMDTGSVMTDRYDVGPAVQRGTLPREIARFFTDQETSHLHNEDPLFTLDSPGTSPRTCSRDGTVHLIPLLDDAGHFQGIHVVITDPAQRIGADDDGLIGSYTLMSGSKE